MFAGPSSARSERDVVWIGIGLGDLEDTEGVLADLELAIRILDRLEKERGGTLEAFQVTGGTCDADQDGRFLDIHLLHEERTRTLLKAHTQPLGQGESAHPLIVERDGHVDRDQEAVVADPMGHGRFTDDVLAELFGREGREVPGRSPKWSARCQAAPDHNTASSAGRSRTGGRLSGLKEAEMSGMPLNGKLR